MFAPSAGPGAWRRSLAWPASAVAVVHWIDVVVAVTEQPVLGFAVYVKQSDAAVPLQVKVTSVTVLVMHSSSVRVAVASAVLSATWHPKSSPHVGSGAYVEMVRTCSSAVETTKEVVAEHSEAVLVRHSVGSGSRGNVGT